MLNKVMIIGTLGKDPEMKYLPSGEAVVNLSVATNERWTDKKTGEKKEKTEWHRITAFGGQAEVIGKYLTKGSKAYFEGKLETRKWQAQDGSDRYTTEIRCNNFSFVESKKDGTVSHHVEPSNADPVLGAPKEKPVFDDDIPF